MTLDPDLRDMLVGIGYFILIISLIWGAVDSSK